MLFLSHLPTTFYFENFQTCRNVEKLEQQVNDTFNSFSENITRQTDERLQEWNNQTNAFSSSMLGIVQAMRDLIVEMENAQKDKK